LAKPSEAYTNASLIVREDYSFDDGLFSGYNAEKRQYDKRTTDVFDHIRGITGNVLLQQVPDAARMLQRSIAFLKVCEYIAETSAPDKTASFLYALGWTQHSIGAQVLRADGVLGPAESVQERRGLIRRAGFSNVFTDFERCSIRAASGTC
jgi:anaerobic selenocysteine-containing dehydrogenase